MCSAARCVQVLIDNLKAQKYEFGKAKKCVRTLAVLHSFSNGLKLYRKQLYWLSNGCKFFNSSLMLVIANSISDIVSSKVISRFRWSKVRISGGTRMLQESKRSLINIMLMKERTQSSEEFVCSSRSSHSQSLNWTFQSERAPEFVSTP